MHVEPLEENIGSLKQLVHTVEELKRNYEIGNGCIEDERFHEAVGVFLKARELSQGSTLANKKYQTAVRFDTIKKLLEKGRPAEAMEECNHASSRFGDDPKYKRLKEQVIEARCEQLRELADQSFQAKDYKAAKDHISELRK